MAEEEIHDVIPMDIHDDMPFRLGDIELANHFADLHPSLERLDRLRKEWKFQLKLLKLEWDSAHWLALGSGILAFLLGAISGDVISGGDAKITGIEGISSIGGFGFFQLVVSGIMWIWFFMQITVIFPIMRGHMINILIIWVSAFSAQMMLHIATPNFPIDIQPGEMLGGIVLTAVALFFTYFFWKAVTETRDLHVMEHHVHTDVRVMEQAMEEHSLYAWTGLVIIWLLTLIFNGWTGAHFVADRETEKYGILVLHIISGMFAIFILMHILWFPQRMLGDGTRVRTKAAAFAEAELLDSGISITAEGECSSCNASAPISRNDVGEVIVDCLSEDCNRRGIAGETCEGCNSRYPTRFKCESCGINSPVGDYLPDLEAW